MKIQDITIIKREVAGKLIPGGEDVNLMPGTEVLVTQSLGTSFTLNVNGNLIRIANADADAIGKTPMQLPSDQMIEKGAKITEKILWNQLKTCYDPEIPVNIVDLGLIYEINLSEPKPGKYSIDVIMTLTAPGCGMGPVLQQDVADTLKRIPGINDVEVIMVFDPPWNTDRMSDEAKLELGLFD